MSIKEFTKQGYTIDKDYSKVVYHIGTFNNKQLLSLNKKQE